MGSVLEKYIWLEILNPEYLVQLSPEDVVKMNRKRKLSDISPRTAMAVYKPTGKTKKVPAHNHEGYIVHHQYEYVGVRIV